MRRLVQEGQKPRPLQEKGDQQFGAAGRAAHPREAVGENPAPEMVTVS
jgi:hypothetical protein